MRRATAGQSILEYLVLVALVVVAVAAAAGAIGPAIDSIYSNAAIKANDAATALGSLTVP
jgi:hypothetical protein